MLTFFRMCSAHHESRTGVQTHIILGVCRESPCQAKALGAKGVCGGQALEAEALGAKGGLGQGGKPWRPRPSGPRAAYRRGEAARAGHGLGLEPPAWGAELVPARRAGGRLEGALWPALRARPPRSSLTSNLPRARPGAAGGAAGLQGCPGQRDP